MNTIEGGMDIGPEEVMVKSARKMKLKSVNRETITKRLMEIQEAKEQND